MNLVNIVFFSSDLRISWVMGNLECSCYVGQIKDEDFKVTVVSWNKLYVCLCDCFNIGKLFVILCAVCFVLSITDVSCELLRYIGNDVPDYTLS